jgi:hypothetical protein
MKRDWTVKSELGLSTRTESNKDGYTANAIEGQTDTEKSLFFGMLRENSDHIVSGRLREWERERERERERARGRQREEALDTSQMTRRR